MQQSSATPSLHLDFWGVAEDCCMLSILLAVPSCTYSFWHGVIPTSYFIFILVYTIYEGEESVEICVNATTPGIPAEFVINVAVDGLASKFTCVT